MTSKRSSIPGSGLIVGFLVAMLACAAWIAWNRRVVVTDIGAAVGDSITSSPQSRVDINSATVAELALLPAIGPALAQRIVEDRNAKGAFTSIEDLGRVPGVGKSTIQRLAPYATDAAADTTSPAAPKAPTTQPDQEAEGS